MRGFIYLFLLMFMLASPVFALELERYSQSEHSAYPSYMDIGDDFETEFRAGFGLQDYYYLYKEPGVMENEGSFIGINGFFEYEAGESAVRVEGLFAYGKVDYTSINTGSMDDLDDYMFETRAIYGYTFAKDTECEIMPYFGFGYRYLLDESENTRTTTGHWGYDRESNYFYSPIGVKFEFKISDELSFKPVIEYDIFWSGTQKSYLGYIPGYQDVTNKQDSGYGFRVSCAVEYETKHMSVAVTPFVRYWDIDKSNVVNSTYEPANETLEIGLEAMILF